MTASSNRAVIWDMDGVIADTAAYHRQAWQETFHERGINFTEDDFKYSFGRRNDSIIPHILGEGTSPEEIALISDQKEVSFRRLIGQNIKPLPGVMRLIKSLAEAKLKLALASSTPIENIELLNKSLSISHYFQSIVADKDVSEGKPSPQVFLLAAQKLGIEPKNCIVIEDAVAGVTAAKRAGMCCIAVTTTHPRDSLKEADLIIDTLESITIDALKNLLNQSRET